MMGKIEIGPASTSIGMGKKTMSGGLDTAGYDTPRRKEKGSIIEIYLTFD